MFRCGSLLKQLISAQVETGRPSSHTVYIGGIERERATLESIVATIMPLGQLINVVRRLGQHCCFLEDSKLASVSPLVCSSVFDGRW